MNQNQIDTLICDEEAKGKRADAFIAEKTGISRSKVQKMISTGSVMINGESVVKKFLLSPNDEIEIFDLLNENIDAEPENIPISVLYEDGDIIVVDKPQGMVVHPAPGNRSGTLVNALLYHCSGTLSGINGKIRPGIVHRIDKDTSGVLVCAKNDEAHEKLAEMISKHDFERKYVAILYGTPDSDSGDIDLAVGRSLKDRKKMAFFPKGSKNAKDALTHYKVLERFAGYSLVEFVLETGRTHQIRVHSLSMGHPVLADPVYAKGRETFGLSGQCLHAKFLSFRHPITGVKLSFESPMPEYFQKALENLRIRYKINE